MSAYHVVLIAHLFGLAFDLVGASTIGSIFLIASRRGQATREVVPSNNLRPQPSYERPRPPLPA